MLDFEYCFLDDVNDGVQYVRFERRPDRPLDQMPDDAVLKDRNIVRVQEQTGTTVDPESGEQVPVYSVVTDKYHKWNGSALEAMTNEEKAARDTYDYNKRIATISPQLFGVARIFRAILRQHFGDNAEINQEVTEEAVKEYFINRKATLSVGDRLDDVSDASLLERGFQMIKDWTSDGTSWSFPWGVLN